VRYFTDKEFTCKCGCGKNNIKEDFLLMLIAAREISDVSYIINSGCRCEAHNKAVGSSSKNHVEGRAVDIKAVDSRTRFKILKGLISAGFTRIGIHERFIHADNMDVVGSPPDVCWLY